jgi:hypothetical protein
VSLFYLTKAYSYLAFIFSAVMIYLFSDVTVLVTLFDRGVVACVKLNKYLEELARTQFKHVKMIRMDASESADCGISIDRVALPILQVYFHGEFVIYCIFAIDCIEVT